jgi:hypothetical protein
MRILGWKSVVALVSVTACYVSTIPVFASTDDTGKSETPAKRAVAKVDAPAPLTERERWLLDRVEELEKRVADLESKGKTSESPAVDASAAQPAAVNPAATDATSIASGATSVNPGPPSNDRVSAVGPQATE